MSEYHVQLDQKASRSGALDQLDQEIERLGKAISALSERLGPVTTQYASVPDRDSVPHPEPSTQLRGRIERLSAATSRLEAMAADIDL